MGIPSYYTYLIKNYKSLIKNISSFQKKVNYFYLDSNSIIYDSLFTLDVNKKNLEEEIIKKVCLKIDEYIKIINPTDGVYIAFDGIAPVAKLKQQKERRFKSKLLESFMEEELNIKKSKFDRACITPGTEFMRNVDSKVKKFFKNRENIYGVKKIVFSGSMERGEGEHKIFGVLRNIKETKEKTHVVYGLDADLIILALNHMEYSKNIYLFRETPEFIKSINIDIDPNELYLMKISSLMTYIIDTMVDNIHTKEEKLIKDYVFLMMFMGNDFLPHFPSLNIRTFGIDTILTIYKNILGGKKLRLIDENNVIEWRNVRELVTELARLEHENMKNEYKIRERISRNIRITEKQEKKKLEMKINMIPMMDREKEYYIDPYSRYWEKRYYETLFNTERTDENIEKISVNYLEGLLWNMTYYTDGCLNWKWTYKYSYPPLFVDLLRFIPLWDVDLLKENDENISFNEQLAYVLPKESLHLLDESIKDKVDFYKIDRENVDLKWSFCKYFWECHIEFKEERLSEISKIVKNE
tara:strand:- start:6944 stop:8521 length:1578 start_codon:yes stop_codon:yes gene_type:complete